MFNFSLIGAKAAGIENPKGVLGIEVSPELAGCCSLGNISPRQEGGYKGLPALDPMWYRNDPGRDDAGNWRFNSAIQLATTCALPPDGATLVATEADLEPLGAMAALALRLQGFGPAPAANPGPHAFCPVCERPIQDSAMVQSNSDYYDCANPGCRWREDAGLLNGNVSKRIWQIARGERPAELAGITQAILSPAASLDQKVCLMIQWLMTSGEPES